MTDYQFEQLQWAKELVDEMAQYTREYQIEMEDAADRDRDLYN